MRRLIPEKLLEQSAKARSQFVFGWDPAQGAVRSVVIRGRKWRVEATVIDVINGYKEFTWWLP